MRRLTKADWAVDVILAALVLLFVAWLILGW